jgi:hypothetical protein
MLQQRSSVPGSRRLLEAQRALTASRIFDPVVAFAALAVLAFALLLYEGRGFTFQGDEWDFLLHRRGHSLSVFLTPHNEHLSALPILAYKLLFQIFGARSAVPFRVLAAVLATICATLVFVLARRRLGGWVALAPAAVMLFLGPGWQDMLWGFQIGYLGSLAAGLGALLALERGDRRGDLWATLLLIVSLACSSVGIVVLIGVVVELLLVTRLRNWQRLWVVAVPALLYALWFTQYGVSRVRLSLINTIPTSAFTSLSAVAGSLTGLTRPAAGPYSVTIDPGSTIAVLLLIVLAVRLLRGGPLSARFWALAAMIVAWWILDALSYVTGRDPASSKYMYPLAALVLLLAAEGASRWRLRGRGLALLGLVALIAIVSNIGFLRLGAYEFRRDSIYARTELGAMQVARGLVPASFSPAEPAIVNLVGNPNVTQIDAGSYFSAVDAFGSPADTVTRLLREPEEVREAGDLVLVEAEGITLRSGQSPARGCTRLRPAGGRIDLTSGPAQLVLSGGRAGVGQVMLRRFASSYNYVDLGRVAPGAAVALALPSDHSILPWHVGLTAAAPVTVCRLR